jgi:hypothetical protein
MMINLTEQGNGTMGATASNEILVTLMMEALSSSETSVLTRATGQLQDLLSSLLMCKNVSSKIYRPILLLEECRLLG